MIKLSYRIFAVTGICLWILALILIPLLGKATPWKAVLVMVIVTMAVAYSCYGHAELRRGTPISWESLMLKEIYEVACITAGESTKGGDISTYVLLYRQDIGFRLVEIPRRDDLKPDDRVMVLSDGLVKIEKILK